MKSETLAPLQSGWAYTLSGKPVAYTMPPGQPGLATFTTFNTWWEALRYAVLYAHIYPACEYIGGPGQ